MPRTKTEQVSFYLDRLTKKDLLAGAELRDGGNQGRMANIAIEFYLDCLKNGDKKLDKFLSDRIRKMGTK